MLDKGEEYRVAACIDVVKRDIETDPRHGDSYMEPGLDLKTQLWLAEKLKELNDEIKELKKGCMHKEASYQEAEGDWLIEKCSDCDIVIGTWLR